ncbi:MAG: hypothetical protein ACJ735_15445 [Actinomycetes bacterium]
MAISIQHDEDVLDVIASGIRPEIVLDMVAAHDVMSALQGADVRRGGCWLFAANVWQRFDQPWSGPDTPDGAQLVGTVYVTHGAPTAYDVTVNRVTVTPVGADQGWKPEAVLSDALRLAGFTMGDCGPIGASPG